MNLTESLAAGCENVDRLSFIQGAVFLIVSITLATHLAIMFLFGSQLTADQIDAIWTVAELGFILLIAFPLLDYLSGVIEAFEWRSGDAEDPQTETAVEDAVSFETTDRASEEIETDAREGRA